MELKDALYTRRSVRQYSKAAVSQEDLTEMIRAGMMAPSAGNQQPWHFVTITDKAKLSQVGKLNPNARMASKAPAAILVCGDSELEMHPGYWVQDCTAAVQNILLTAHDMGFGAVWTGIWPRTDRVEGFKEAYNLPASVNPLALIVIGGLIDGDSKKDTPNRFKPDRIHSESW